ncbi:hypothetical protein M426DRAFT_315969 [Hypoxylon sp. CI-4A]|nr:hypothetical protein M426DRAFT_315969 [Hypoxylon sp. CI-4A]
MSQYLEHRAAFESHSVGFVYRQYFMHRKPIPEGTTLSGQIAIVTGSNSGLGFESARQLLQLGLAHLIVAVRSQVRGDAAAEKLRKEFPNSKVSVWLLDMESYDSITSFAKRCETLPRLDIVLLNAGLRNDTFKLVEPAHHEKTLQVNCISTILLTILLLPVLKSKKSSSPNAQPPRLSVVTSDTSYWAPPLEAAAPIFPQFDSPKDYEPMRAYSRSKFVQLFFISRLAEEVSADDLILNASNPGLCNNTEFGANANMSFIGGWIFWAFINIFGRTVETGASTMVDAVVTKGKESHGSYVSDWIIQPYPKVWYTNDGKAIRERIWEETLEELNFAGASRIIQEMKR